MTALHRLLTVIRHADFRTVANDAHEGDFVYFDPPYVPLNKTSSFTSYTKDEFSLEQHIRLAKVAQQLANEGVKVMLSNSNSNKVRELYQGWHIHEVKAMRALNGKADGRGKIIELVITNYCKHAGRMQEPDNEHRAITMNIGSVATRV